MIPLAQNFDLVNYVKTNTENYTGEYEKIIRNGYKYMQTLLDLLNSPDIMDEERKLLLICAGYLILADDLYPESKYGAEGFTDDILLVMYSINELIECGKEHTVKKCWRYEENDFDAHLKSDYKTLKKGNEELLERMLIYTGIRVSEID